ncbi:aspartate aminotransferase family protein [Amycolatopsis jiangsuensis]|uniref:Adenosylmethionine-8-amino-7-oxononanoate aminotransferase n=1 Tax=Amycolatopsis jiangsuensis TaxID=1181879 RepID=A0A840IRS1_9PSEU|nr:aspartate aminotransferase family protein [Amycolatopsis jiangsuensis]MBB4684077.1 adenosylmethionine-8-amino-7-oxononanoate aminotransferase [Amycolatopsis jiangsuensis]
MVDTTQLRAQARRHLGPHFTRGAQWHGADFPVFVRGEGCHLYDSAGRRYLDGLAGLFCVNLGHGRTDLVAAAAKQMETLPYATNWGAAHPPAIEAATRIAELAPGDLSTTFFVSSGSEAAESAIKFARQYHRSQGEPGRTKIISRDLAYHGTTLGALSVTGLPKIKEAFGPLLPGIRHVPNTLGYTGDCGEAAALDCVRAIEEALLQEGPETVAAIFAEPVQNGRGALVPPDGYWAELRRIADEYGVLLVADEVICSFGRLGHWFGSERFGVVPDVLTFAKGSTSGYAPLGGMIVREPLMQGLFDSPLTGAFTHGATWGGHPVPTAITSAVIDAMTGEAVLDNVRTLGPHLRAGLDDLAANHRCVREVRGTGYFYAVELTADHDTGRELTAAESTRVLREVIPAAFDRTGVILRGDDRGATMLMISPPLVADRTILSDLLHGLDGILSDIEAALPR